MVLRCLVAPDWLNRSMFCLYRELDSWLLVLLTDRLSEEDSGLELSNFVMSKSDMFGFILLTFCCKFELKQKAS